MIVPVVVTFIELFVPAFSAVLVLRVVLSYLMRPETPVMMFLASLTEPVLGPIRKIIPASGGIDFAPLVALLLLQLLQYAVFALLT